MRLVVAKSPSEALALTNCLILNPSDAKQLGTPYVLAQETHMLTIRYGRRRTSITRWR